MQESETDQGSEDTRREKSRRAEMKNWNKISNEEGEENKDNKNDTIRQDNTRQDRQEKREEL